MASPELEPSLPPPPSCKSNILLSLKYIALSSPFYPLRTYTEKLLREEVKKRVYIYTHTYTENSSSRRSKKTCCVFIYIYIYTRKVFVFLEEWIEKGRERERERDSKNR